MEVGGFRAEGAQPGREAAAAAAAGGNGVWARAGRAVRAGLLTRARPRGLVRRWGRGGSRVRAGAGRGAAGARGKAGSGAAALLLGRAQPPPAPQPLMALG